MQTWCYGWDLLGPPLFVFTDSDGLLKLKLCFCCRPHRKWCIHPPPTLPTPTTTTSTTKLPVHPFLLLFSDISVSKNLPQTRGHRENRDLMHASSEDLFADPLQVRGRLLPAGWWSSLVAQPLITVQRWGYRNHMGQWDWFLKIYSIWYITVLEDCNYQLTCYKSGRQICIYIYIIYAPTLYPCCQNHDLFGTCDIFGFTGQKRTNENLFVCSVWALSWSVDPWIVYWSLRQISHQKLVKSQSRTSWLVCSKKQIMGGKGKKLHLPPTL